jgi:hypothetical protein
MGNSMSRGGYGGARRGYGGGGYGGGGYGGGGLGTQPVAAPRTRRPFFHIGWRGNRGGGMRTTGRQQYTTGAPVRRRRNRFGLHFGRNRGY